MSPMKNFHSCRMHDSGTYEKMRYKKQDGADVVMGMKKDGSWEVQAIRYPKESFKEAEARASCGKHGGSFEAASGMAEHTDTLLWMGSEMAEWNEKEDGKFPEITVQGKFNYSQSMRGVEIFKAGTWRGDKYTVGDLGGLVSAFYALSLKPPLKLGHDESQKWFGQVEGAPALGWVANPRMVGDTLVADFENVPDVVVQLIKDKRYRTVSPEIYWNYKNPEGRVFPRALKAVSLLGADIPAVTTLKDLQAALMSDTTRSINYVQTEGAGNYVPSGHSWTYTDTNGTREVKWYVYDGIQGGDPMDAEKEKKYTDEIEGLKAQIKKLTDDTKAESDKTAAAEARALKAESTIASKEEEHSVAQFTAKVDGLVKDGKVLPSEKEGLVRTFQALGPGTKKYGDKEVNPREDFSKSLEARPKVIEFKEKGTRHEEKDGAVSPAVALDAMAQEFMKEKKCTYTEAVKMVKDADPELWAAYMTPGKGGK